MITPSSRRRPRVALTVSSPTEEPVDRTTDDAAPNVPWLLAAVVGGVAAACLGWLAVAVLAVSAWLTALHVPLAAVLDTIGQGWLAIHGAPASLDGVVVGVPPLGLSGLAAAGCVVAAHHAAGQRRAVGDGRWATCARVAAATAIAYLATVLLVGSLAATPGQAVAALPGALAVAAPASAFGAWRGLALDPLAAAPPWTRGLPVAMGGGLLVLVLGSGAALLTGLLAHGDQVAALHASLGPDPAGGVLLVVVQLLYLPNLVLWAGSYALGAGVRVGLDTLVAPGTSALGALPALPVAAALPTDANPWTWGWVAVGPVAGALAGWLVLRRGQRAGALAHLGWWSAQGAAAGALVGVVWVGASWLSRGHLGGHRLVGLGPRFPELLWYGIPPLAVAGALTGLAYAWWCGRRRARAAAEDAAERVPLLAGRAGGAE